MIGQLGGGNDNTLFQYEVHLWQALSLDPCPWSSLHCQRNACKKLPGSILSR